MTLAVKQGCKATTTNQPNTSIVLKTIYQIGSFLGNLKQLLGHVSCKIIGLKNLMREGGFFFPIVFFKRVSQRWCGKKQ